MKFCKNREQTGITLIALVITIVVMLILVAVSINMTVNRGIFDYAGKAVGETKNALNQEQQLINDIMDEYFKPNLPGTEDSGEDEEPITGNNGETFSAIYATTATYTDGNGETATIPAGFAVGTSEGINKIDTGLVIRDEKGNEFVWIPVEEDLGSFYACIDGYSEYYEPKELTGTWSNSTLETKPKYDSQEILDELYGANYYTYSEDFKYAEEYAEMVEKVNQYNGFYIGRYETTIDNEGNIGSVYNTPVLTVKTILFTKDGTEYEYGWHGLYYANKNTNVSGNGTNVQTAMIYGVMWDKTMQFIRDQKATGKTTYDVDTITSSWHTGSSVVNSGQLNPGEAGDVALNIWDLESNAWEWTQESYSNNRRILRGGATLWSKYKASQRNHGGGDPMNWSDFNSSRVGLYILK